MAHYEVYCHSCSVTFPPETKACLHCGGRTRKDPPRAATAFADVPAIPFLDEPAAATMRPAETSLISMLSRADAGSAAAGAAIATGAVASPDYVHPEAAEEDGQEGAGRRSLLRAGMSVLWMVVLAGAYAWRACSG